MFWISCTLFQKTVTRFKTLKQLMYEFSLKLKTPFNHLQILLHVQLIVHPVGSADHKLDLRQMLKSGALRLFVHPRQRMQISSLCQFEAFGQGENLNFRYGNYWGRLLQFGNSVSLSFTHLNFQLFQLLKNYACIFRNTVSIHQPPQV